MKIPSYAQASMKAYRETGSIESKGRVELDKYGVEDSMDEMGEQLENFRKTDNGPLDLDTRPNYIEAQIEEFDGLVTGGYKESPESDEVWMTVKPNGEAREVFFYSMDTGDTMDSIAVAREDIDEPHTTLQHHFDLYDNPELDRGYILHS